jgi:enoyl-CoA hydratase/carnithine racemase|tara:strand:+ start:552 stop:1397 length:846 start_codon:yes stop_codon:yes gene_type:complete
MVKEYENLKIEDHGHVVICILTNPPTHTFTSKSLMEVHDFLDQMEKKKDLRVLAFTGEGEDVFIKHYEVGELADSAEKNISEAKEVSAGYSPPKELHHFHKMLLRLRDIEAIVIAGINGNTAGGGCEFSLGCDLRIMSEGPYAIGLPETSVGILPGGGGTQRLARLIGSSRALDLILHARLLSPQEAFEFGLINKLVPHERFREELMAYCSDLASRAPIALRQVKKIIHKGLDKTLEEGLLMEQEAFDVTMRSNDAAKAMRSMLDTERDIKERAEFKWEGN